MQIHELNTFSGTPGANDWLATDNGTDTSKIPATKLGVTTQMTQAEAEAGTGTNSRVITPKVFHDSVEAIMAQSPLTITMTATDGTTKTVTVVETTQEDNYGNYRHPYRNPS